jgi:peptide/nickel transport system substrate-binding protein
MRCDKDFLLLLDQNQLRMKKSSHYTLFIFTAAFFCLVQFTSCKRISSNDKNSIVVTSWPSEPPTLHPVCGNPSSARILVFEYTQKTLTRTDLRTLQQIPILVKSVAQVSPDGKEFTYELREDVKWDDGSPLTVDDIIFTMKVNKCKLTDDDQVRSTYDNVQDIVKDASNPLKFKMLAKDVYFLNRYIFNELYIVEKKFWDPAGVLDKISIPDIDRTEFDGNKYPGLTDWMKNFNDGANGHKISKLTGLGPYAVTNWKPGNSVTLTRKEKWWGVNDTSAYSRAYPSAIIVKIIPDDQARYLALKNHNLDAEVWLYTDSYLKLKADKDFNDRYYSGITDQFSFNLIFLNMKPDGKEHPRLFDDKDVRHAMAYLTPVDEINNTMVKGMGTRQASFIKPVYKNYYNDTLKLIPYDVEKAKKLLETAGWMDTDGDNIRDKVVDGKKIPLSFRLTYSSNPTNKQIMLMIKEAMYKAGVEVIPDPVDMGELQNKARRHNFDMLMSGFSGTAIPDDPDLFLGSENWTNNGSNYTGFGDATTDNLIQQSNRTLDENKRIGIFKQLQAIVYDQQPFIFLYGVKRKVIISKKFDNAGMYADRPGVMLNNLKLR